MTSNHKIINHENINGINVMLQVDNRSNSPNSQRFTVSYKTKEKTSGFTIKSLVLAVIFNALAFFYVSLSMQSLIVIIIVLSFLIFFWITHTVQSESLLVIPTVGIQSSIKYVYGREDYFVPWSSINDVIINEVIKLNRVLYVLTLIVKTGNSEGEDTESIKLIPLFKYTKPRLLMLETVYRELQALLAVSTKEDTEKGAGDTKQL